MGKDELIVIVPAGRQPVSAWGWGLIRPLLC